jgi:hypothetical protein
MSDNWVNFVPEDPRYVPDRGQIKRAVKEASRLFPRADSVNAELPRGIEFFHPGGNFEGVFCPACGKAITDWWGDALDLDRTVPGVRPETLIEFRAWKPSSTTCRKTAFPESLVQHSCRSAGADGAAAASGNAAADWAGRPGAAVSDGADYAGGEPGAGDRDSRPGAAGVCAVAAFAAVPGAAAGEGAGYAGEDLLQVRGREPGGKRTSRIRRWRRPITTKLKARSGWRRRRARGSGDRRWRWRARSLGWSARCTWCG